MDIDEDTLKWVASQNGVSIDVSMDIRVHHHASDTIVVILPGIDGSADGYKNKYVQMAKLLVSKQNKAFVRASNHFVSSFHWEDNFRHLVDYATSHAKEISGNDKPSIEVIAHSAGASVTAWLAHEYPDITKLLLINPAQKLEEERIISGLEQFKGEVIVVFGSKDPSIALGEKLPERCQIEIVDGADHHFSGNHLSTFVFLVDHLT